MAILSRRPRASSVFFPWEENRGLLGALSQRRIRAAVALGALTFGVVAIYEAGERAAGVRATRASLTTAGRGVAAYRADHKGVCPRGLPEIVALGYLDTEPLDAWGRPLRLVCPGRQDPLGFELTSDGPDGVPLGLDAVR
jgi:general secretion pathway protein G